MAEWLLFARTMQYAVFYERLEYQARYTTRSCVVSDIELYVKCVEHAECLQTYIAFEDVELLVER